MVTSGTPLDDREGEELDDDGAVAWHILEGLFVHNLSQQIQASNCQLKELA